MALLLPKQLISSCDDRTRNIVNGYIRESQKVFPWQEISYYIIPEVINHICLAFYWIALKFNKKHIHQDLKIINDTTVTRNTDIIGWALCLIDQSISGWMCDRFTIDFTFNGDSNGTFVGFYALENIINLIGSGIKWCFPPGFDHVPDSVGIFNSDDSLYACQDGAVFLKKWVGFDSWEKITLEFDFTRSKCHVYHNEEKTGIILPIKGCCIIPAVALRHHESTAEITKYEFVKNND